MRRPASLWLAAVTVSTIALALRVGGSEPLPFRPGQSFHVVALRAHVDTALFRVCEPGSRHALQPAFPGLELTPSGDDRTSNLSIKDRIESEFRHQKRFPVVPSRDRADYVLIAEGTSVRMSEPGTSLFARPGAKEEPDAFTSVVAIAVPPGAYAANARNPTALLRASVWQGASIGTGDQIASPEDVVLQLHGQPQRLAASGARADDRARDERLRPSRLDGRSICAIPQPARAPAMPPENEYVPDMPEDRLPRLSPKPGQPIEHLPTFQTRVIAVAVPVVASNSQGASVGGLNTSEFKVFEDDIPQRIDRMTAASEPLTAALVMDTSYSMLPRLARVREAAEAFIDALRPGDRALAVAFDSRAWLVCDVTPDKDALRRAIVRLQPSGALTRVHDALDLVTEERLERIAGRKALVVLTDGMDVGSRFASAGNLMARLESANIPVYAVPFDSGETRKISRPMPVQPALDTTPERYFDRIISSDHAREYLAQLTRNTGGLLLPASNADAIVQAFRRAADDVRSQYVLYYYPSNQAQDGTFRRIRVEVTRPGVTLRARAGYRAPGPK